MNYNTTFCKMNLSKYGKLSLCFPQFKMVYIFLEYCTFFRTSIKWCFRIFRVFQYETKQLKWNTIITADEHNQIAYKINLRHPLTIFLISKCFSRSLSCVTWFMKTKDPWGEPTFVISNDVIFLLLCKILNTSFLLEV